MARRAPAPDISKEDLISKIEEKEKQAEGKWHSYQCKLVTPMYGGGVKAGEVDREMPIRASEIRGQLRFWWRLSCGPFESPEEMFRNESEIWGGIGADQPTASKVEVRVKKQFNPVTEAAFEYKSDDKSGKYKTMPTPALWADGYALFSAQGKLSEDKRRIQQAPGECVKPNNDNSYDFILELRIDSELSQHQRAEVEQAVRWWASFGGIGARTRRGLGAINVIGIEPVSNDEVLSKGGVLKTLKSPNKPLEAWKISIGKLKEFRQGKGIGRNPAASDSKSPAGRSLWPEADALRALSGQSGERHRNRLVDGDNFPRAAFGLPIVFHFIKPDPDDHILEPANVSRDNKRERMASPLILRPYWNGATWQPAALLIPGWERALEQKLKFKGQAYQPENWPKENEARKKMAEKIIPLKTSKNPDPLSAFMDFFERGL
jgi:CRISPR-associated protein Cmr1